MNSCISMTFASLVLLGYKIFLLIHNGVSNVLNIIDRFIAKQTFCCVHAKSQSCSPMLYSYCASTCFFSGKKHLDAGHE